MDDDGNVLLPEDVASEADITHADAYETYRDEPELEEPRDDQVERDEIAPRRRPRALGATPSSSSATTIPGFVIDLLGPGALSFGATHKITRFATDKYGRKAGAATAIGTTLATLLATRKSGKIRLPVVAGAGISTLETLFKMFVSDAEQPSSAGKPPAPAIRTSVTAFRHQIARMQCSVRVATQQATIRGRSGAYHRVLVIQYAAQIFGSTWVTQEVRKFDADGHVDITDTLLERLVPRASR